MPSTRTLLARGPWELDQVRTRWHETAYSPSPEERAAADVAIAELRGRGSPSHDGLSARLIDYRAEDGGIEIELQPARWALRLVPGNACESVAALCLIRSADGQWLAGRRAAWLSSWAGRWALGAGGAVEVGENPATTLVREAREEWSVDPVRVRAEALVSLPHKLVMFVGMAWLADDACVVPDHEHDAFAWWPADVSQWPPEADDALRRMGKLLSG
ncbi:MAG TPA: NUDIX hydrolase [Solirubrobacteraceae bacterium]|nr:NUDIX hydrolase [Solirubrobacteraceae bacterium]